MNLDKGLSVICEQKAYVPLDARKKRSLAEETSLGFVGSAENVIRQKRKAEETEETEEEISQRSYGSTLGYECGLARRFEDPETLELYSERWMTCNWNKTWTPVDTVDECVWIQCINPPEVDN